MDHQAPEIVVHTLDQLFAWRAAKPPMTIIHAHVGRVLLTTQRFLFLSTGTNGIARALLFNAVGGALLQVTLGQTRTDQLDLSALWNRGSLNLWLDQITRSYVGRKWDFTSYLAVETAGHGPPHAYSFTSRYGLQRGELLFLQETLERERALRPAHPDGAPRPH